MRNQIYQLILDNAITEGEKAISKYDKIHKNDVNWSVGWGDVYVLGNSGFTKWYRKQKKTRKHVVAIDEGGGGGRYQCSLLWANTVQKELSAFGVETRNDVHLD